VFSCGNKPAGLSSFAPASFAGYWNLNYATLYRNDKMGCATLQVSSPNSRARLETTFSKNTIFSWNFFTKGKS
jgi:hypothetical protein